MTALSHFWPVVLVAITAKRWVPAARLIEVLSDLDAVEYFFTPSIHSCVLAMVPETVAVACTFTGELTLEPLVGLQI